MALIKADWLKDEEIWNLAEDFRKTFVSPIDQVPVDIINISEITLGIHPNLVPNLYQKWGIYAFLTPDSKFMYIDEESYTNSKWEFPLRFTIAHEVGHYYMHNKQMQSVKFKDIEQYIDFRTNLDDKIIGPFEYQGYEFAGRLLVSKDALTNEVEKRKDKIEQAFEVDQNISIEFLCSYVAIGMSKIFEVSEEVISRRICREKIIESLIQS